jgi:ATP-dependent Clp protease ATP-binding subunit ClpC
VFVTKHHGGLTSAVLLRRYRVMFDPPPPAAMAEDQETALTRLAPQAALIAEHAENAQRYLWTEQLELRRIEVDIHPGRPDPRGYVIAGATVPIKLAYAAAPLFKPHEERRLWRVLVPRFDWSFVAEDLDAVPDTVRALVFASLIGDAPASLYDLRRELEEQIVEWSPIEAAGRVRTKAEEQGDPAPNLEAVAEDWVGMARADRLPPVVGVDPIFDEIASLLDDKRMPSLLFVGPRGSGKTALVRRIARGLMDRSRGKGAAKRRLWATSADRIVAGMVYLGMWQQRCLAIVKELEGGGDVLFIDRLADAMAPMSDGAAITDLMAPAILAGELSLFAECDEAELVRARQRNPALLDAMRIVRVPEASAAQVIALLEPLGQRLDPPVARGIAPARRATRRVPA